ncbi:MAG: TonB C-terminal domain-containing protein [Polyangiaceae bacterium]
MLWIAAALHVHFAAGVSATFLTRVLGIARFASQVANHMDGTGSEVEVALLDESTTEPDPAEPKPVKQPEKEPPRPEPEPESKPPAPLPKPAPPKPEEKQIKIKIEEQDKAPPQKLTLDAKNRIAVRQHVEDKNQEDNPNAKLIADEANHVKQETQARITSTDQNDPKPTPGGQHSGPSPAPGNAEDTKVAQSEDHEGVPDQAPEPAGKAPSTPEQAKGAQPAAQAPKASPPKTAQAAAQSQEPKQAQQPSPDMMTSDSGEQITSKSRTAQDAQKQRKRKKKRLPPAKPDPNAPQLGLGSALVTASGVNLGLTQKQAFQAIGRDRLALEKRLDSERRKSAHRGSWKSLGIEKWRSAIENYVPSVRPGNQTALNTARVPFASYLNTIHNRLHPIFADSFLGSLDSLPGTHPMNRPDIKTHLEIVLSQEDGRVVRMGVTRTSGVTAFDIAALESVQRAAPYGAPPKEIISPDGNVYFHWEFHRNPYYACSTYFARPYILKVQPKSAPPKVAPPDGPEEGEPSDQQRHGMHRAGPPLLEKRASLR